MGAVLCTSARDCSDRTREILRFVVNDADGAYATTEGWFVCTYQTIAAIEIGSAWLSARPARIAYGFAGIQTTVFKADPVFRAAKLEALIF